MTVVDLWVNALSAKAEAAFLASRATKASRTCRAGDLSSAPPSTPDGHHGRLRGRHGRLAPCRSTTTTSTSRPRPTSCGCSSGSGSPQPVGRCDHRSSTPAATSAMAWCVTARFRCPATCSTTAWGQSWEWLTEVDPQGVVEVQRRRPAPVVRGRGTPGWRTCCDGHDPGALLGDLPRLQPLMRDCSSGACHAFISKDIDPALVEFMGSSWGTGTGPLRLGPPFLPMERPSGPTRD